MDQLEGEDDSEESVFSLITALCRSLSSGIRNFDAETYDLHQRSLRRIAFSHLLKRSATIIQENHTFTEDIPLAIFTLVASKKASTSNWTPSEYAKARIFLDKLENKFSNASIPSWMWNIGRMLIALELNRPQPPATPKKESPWTLRCMDGLACIPKPFRLSCSQILSKEFDDELSPFDFLWTHFKSQLEKLQLPMRLDTVSSGNSHYRLAIECPGPIKRLPRSISRVDEGFSSPTDAMARRKLNWSLVPTEPKKRHLEWESFSMHPSEQYAIGGPNYCDIKFCPSKLVKVPFPEVMECVKALLVGVSSHIFEEVEGEFCMIPGLYADETPPSLMYVYCKTFRKGGMLFSKLGRLTEYYISLTSASMSVVIQNLILDYQDFIISIPMSTTLLKLCLAITPFINQLEYLVELVEGDIGGWQLLDKLYDDAHQMVDRKLSSLASALFIDCLTTYLIFVEKWIFDGVWHPELFFQKHIALEDICDRYSWSRSYTFDAQNAPRCLPSAEIYECGKLAHLVLSQTCLTDENSLLLDCRPKMKMVTEVEEFMSMKDLCQYYSHIGDELRLEALQKYQNDDELDLSYVAREKSEADSFRYRVEKAAEQESKLYNKLYQVMEMKQQLACFEQHRNTRELKQCLYELLEEDRLTYHLIEKMISIFPLREELVERYFKNEERCIKSYIVNHWKEKRCNLNSLRIQYFEKIYGQNSIDSGCGPTADANIEEIDNSSFHGPVDDAKNDSACKLTPLTTPITSSSKKHPMFSTSFTDSVDQFFSGESLPRPISHGFEHDKGLVSCSSGSLFSTCFEEKIKNPLPCETSTKSLTGDFTVGVSVEDENSIAIEKSVENARTVDMDRFTPSPYCENVVGSCSEPNEPSTEMKREFVDSLINRISTSFSRNVNPDILKPFDYIKRYHSRDGDAQNHCSDSAAIGKDVKHKMTLNHFTKSHLNFLVSKSVEYPLQAQTRVIKNLAFHKMFVENDIIGHFKRLKDVFLKNNGTGSLVFVNMLSKHIELYDPQAFSVHHKLQNIINIAYPMESKFITLKSDYIPQAFDSTNPNVFCFLRLCYKRNWPLNLVITDIALVRYNEVSEFLTSIDLTLVHLQHIFQFLRMKYMDLRGDNYRQIQLHRHVMLTFVNSLKFYTGSTVTDCWNEMYSDLLSVHDPDQIYWIHVRFLKNLHTRLLLQKNTERVQECLTKALHYILVYCQTVLHTDWTFSVNGDCTHPKYKKLLHTFANFKEMVSGSQKLVNYFIIEHGYIHLKILSQIMNC